MYLATGEYWLSIKVFLLCIMETCEFSAVETYWQKQGVQFPQLPKAYLKYRSEQKSLMD